MPGAPTIKSMRALREPYNAALDDPALFRNADDQRELARLRDRVDKLQRALASSHDYLQRLEQRHAEVSLQYAALKQRAARLESERPALAGTDPL